MKLRTLVFHNERQANEFVRSNSTGPLHAKWDGWKIKTFVQNRGAEFNVRGSFVPGLGFGYMYTFSPNRAGKWIVKVPA